MPGRGASARLGAPSPSAVPCSQHPAHLLTCLCRSCVASVSTKCQNVPVHLKVGLLLSASLGGPSCRRPRPVGAPVASPKKGPAGPAALFVSQRNDVYNIRRSYLSKEALGDPPSEILLSLLLQQEQEQQRSSSSSGSSFGSSSSILPWALHMLLHLLPCGVPPLLVTESS